MVKHFCDICQNEMTKRIKMSITAKEVCGESYLQTVGENLMDTDYECCDECYGKLVDIIDAVSQKEPSSIFDKLKKLLKHGKEEQ